LSYSENITTALTANVNNSFVEDDTFYLKDLSYTYNSLVGFLFTMTVGLSTVGSTGRRWIRNC